jgi:hypothetical protein
MDPSHTQHGEKSMIVDDFYTRLLSLAGDRNMTVDLDRLGMSSFNLEELDSRFSEEEIWETIEQLPSDKATGPDGFTGRFYKICWPIIKEDVLAVLSAVWSRNFAHFDRVNTTYVTVIPKKEGAVEVKDFRPISLVHSIAKIVTKLLANRLAPNLQDMVSARQSALIKGRFIQDNFMLVQQTARLLYQQKKGKGASETRHN